MQKKFKELLKSYNENGYVRLGRIATEKFSAKLIILEYDIMLISFPSLIMFAFPKENLESCLSK